MRITQSMKSGNAARATRGASVLATSAILSVLLCAAPLFATDDTAGKKPAEDSPTKRTPEEKPIKSLKDLMQRQQKQASTALLSFRGNQPTEALAAIKKVDEYAAEIEKWLPDPVSKDETKKKRFLELVADVRKGTEATMKLLDPPQTTKANQEFGKAMGKCTTCHNEFRPKK